MEITRSLLPQGLSLTDCIKPFACGFVFLALNAVQQCNTIYKRPWSAGATSLALGFCVFTQTHYVATGAVAQFLLFQLGASCGVMFGIRLGHSMKR